MLRIARSILLAVAAAAVVLLLPLSASAQTNVRVLGVGRVAFELALDQAGAQGQRYRLYVPAASTAAGVVLTVTCAPATPGPLTTCSFPLSAITLPAAPATVGFAITAAVTAADGEVESSRVTAPFVLSRAVPPVGPSGVMSVQPPQP